MSPVRALTETNHSGDEAIMAPQRQTSYLHKYLLITETTTGIHTIQPVSGQRGDNRHGTEMTRCSQTHNMDTVRSKPPLTPRTPELSLSLEQYDYVGGWECSSD